MLSASPSLLRLHRFLFFVHVLLAKERGSGLDLFCQRSLRPCWTALAPPACARVAWPASRSRLRCVYVRARQAIASSSCGARIRMRMSCALVHGRARAGAGHARVRLRVRLRLRYRLGTQHRLARHSAVIQAASKMQAALAAIEIERNQASSDWSAPC